ncbi:MAG: hypothetical protein Q8N01_08055 [Sulfuricurvum sp.]|nr:hypothetical protein [Sulfuricurvum sp.]MDP3021983.1 hypothetical protein [Sulfuricurvum sp.]MDP3120352.1 hypothetical protein [Sulfuricurvum sp.]
MKLTLCSDQETVCVTLDEDQFKRLRNPDIDSDEILCIAQECGVNSALLSDYVLDLKKTAQEIIEIDGSCDYSDHL